MSLIKNDELDRDDPVVDPWAAAAAAAAAMAAKCLSKFSWVKVLTLATFSSFSSLVKSEIMVVLGVVDPWDSMMKLMSSLLIRSSLSQMAANADAEWSLHGLVVDDEDDGRTEKEALWCQKEAFFLKSFPLVGKSFQPRPDFLPFPFNSSKARNEMIEFGKIALLASRRATEVTWASKIEGVDYIPLGIRVNFDTFCKECLNSIVLINA